MIGNLNLEREQWGAALQQLKRTRTICSELGRASLAEHAHLYLQTVEEVEPSIRFCAYNLRREGGEAEGEGDDNLDDLAEAEGASDILRSKLEAVLQALCSIPTCPPHHLPACPPARLPACLPSL